MIETLYVQTKWDNSIWKTSSREEFIDRIIALIEQCDEQGDDYFEVTVHNDISNSFQNG